MDTPCSNRSVEELSEKLMRFAHGTWGESSVFKNAYPCLDLLKGQSEPGPSEFRRDVVANVRLVAGPCRGSHSNPSLQPLLAPLVDGKSPPLRVDELAAVDGDFYFSFEPSRIDHSVERLRVLLLVLVEPSNFAACRSSDLFGCEPSGPPWSADSLSIGL